MPRTDRVPWRVAIVGGLTFRGHRNRPRVCTRTSADSELSASTDGNTRKGLMARLRTVLSGVLTVVSLDDECGDAAG